MADQTISRIAELLSRHQQQILSDWMANQLAGARSRTGSLSDAARREESGNFLGLLLEALRRGGSTNVSDPAWDGARSALGDLSRSRATQGFTPSETAWFVFSLKRPLFERLRADSKSADQLATEVWFITELIDGLGLHTSETFQKGREEVILRQQQEMMELSTPVIQLWDGILAIPLIGTLDSARTQVVMEGLLNAIVSTESDIAIIDITGVPTVDTLVAQHLLKTVAAARLMGAECIISGIRPQIAQTIVHLGVDLGGITTKSTLADALRVGLVRRGQTVTAARP